MANINKSFLCAFTMSDRRSSLFYISGNYPAFTMAEILISLTIIGIIAAITLPALQSNINEKVWNTQRKALYSRISQAIALMPSLNDFGVLDNDNDTAAQSFVLDGLAKVLKINNICDNEHLADCGIVDSFVDMGGTKRNTPTTLYGLNAHFQSVSYYGASYFTQNTKAVAFETQNSESVITYYNRNCITEFHWEGIVTDLGNIVGFPEAIMCANFVYDLNGAKGPNTVGKDIGFITAFNASDSTVVAPMPTTKNIISGIDYYTAVSTCRSETEDSRLPNIEELDAINLNKNIIGNVSGKFWSSTFYDANRVLESDLANGHRATNAKTMTNLSVRCVKR